MRGAFALVGLGFIVLIVGTYVVTRQSDEQETSRASAHALLAPATTTSLKLTSSAFENNASIPAIYTCDGDQLQPPLEITGAPSNAKSLALIMEDPDVPKKIKPDGRFSHWIVFNIPAASARIDNTNSHSIEGLNGARKAGYTGPCPPAQYEPREHRYFFTLYALDAELHFAALPDQPSLESAMEGHVIAQTQLIGRYQRR